MVKAYAAMAAGKPLEPFEYEPGPLGTHQVDVTVDYCGICHSDLSMIDNEWGMAEFPLVAGHEVTGTVKAVGEHVRHLTPGDRVGVGWHAGYCTSCPQCLDGDQNLCAGATATIVGHHGGFADTVRAQDLSVIKLPEGLDAADAGPLFCGGITVFNPLVQFGISPTAHIGVVGIGGLGHLALQFANAWGCHVTAFTSHAEKHDEARELGAHTVVNSRDPDAIAGLARSLDLILSTVNVPLDWNAYLAALKPKGRLHLLGAVLEPLSVGVFDLLPEQKSISASPVGSPATISRMLDFATRHGIKPTTEHFPMGKVNDALDHLRAGKARYRIVLDRD